MSLDVLDGQDAASVVPIQSSLTSQGTSGTGERSLALGTKAILSSWVLEQYASGSGRTQGGAMR